jgi:hypothetical protein
MTLRDGSIGHDRNLCRAKKRNKQRPGAKTGKNPVFDDSGNELCTRPAGWGTDHAGTGPCKLHAGSTPRQAIAATVIQAKAAVVTFGLPREIDPRDALLEEVYRSAGAVDWLQQQVHKLEADQVVWSKAEEVEKQAGEFPGVDTTHRAAVNVWVELLNRERKHLVDVCRVAIASGLEERRVRLAEQQGAMLASVIKNILGDLDLSPEQQGRVSEVVPRHLRAVG